MESQSESAILALGGRLLGLLWIAVLRNRPGPGLAIMLASHLYHTLWWPTFANAAIAFALIIITAFWLFIPQIRTAGEFAIAKGALFKRQRRARKAADLARRAGSVTLDTVDGPVLFVAATSSEKIYMFPETIRRHSLELLRSIAYEVALAGEDEFPVFKNVTHGTVYSFCLDDIRARPIEWTGVAKYEDKDTVLLRDGKAVMVGDITRFREPVRAPRRKRAPSIVAGEAPASPPLEHRPAETLFDQLAENVEEISSETTGVSAGGTPASADEGSRLESGGSDSEPDSEPTHLADAEPSPRPQGDGSESAPSKAREPASPRFVDK